VEKLDQALGANFKVPRQLVVDASVRPEDIAAVVESESSPPAPQAACALHPRRFRRRERGQSTMSESRLRGLHMRCEGCPPTSTPAAARRAQELAGKGRVKGRFVLCMRLCLCVCRGGVPDPGSGQARGGQRHQLVPPLVTGAGDAGAIALGNPCHPAGLAPPTLPSFQGKWFCSANTGAESLGWPVSGVWCSVFGVRCSVFGVRCSVFGVRCSVCESTA